MYRSIDAVPSRAPRAAPQSKTAKVCPVMGTGVNGKGIAMWAMSPVKRLNAMTRPATPAPTLSGPLMLSAIQRLTARVGYVSAWDGTGAALSKTSDGGMTWQRLPIPAAYLTSLRFIDESVGWAAGFVNRENPQILCRQNAPVGVQPCKGVVLRTQDGGHQWETVLAVKAADRYRQGGGTGCCYHLEGLAFDRGYDYVLGEPMPEVRALSHRRRRADLVETGQSEGLHDELFRGTPGGPALRQHRTRLAWSQPGCRRRAHRPRRHP